MDGPLALDSSAAATHRKDVLVLQADFPVRGFAQRSGKGNERASPVSYTFQGYKGGVYICPPLGIASLHLFSLIVFHAKQRCHSSLSLVSSIQRQL